MIGDRMQSEPGTGDPDFYQGASIAPIALAPDSMTKLRITKHARRTTGLLLGSLLLVLSACGGDGGGIVDPDGTWVQGVVFRAGTQVRLPDVPVTMDGRQVMSDSRGSYRFDDAPLGEVTLSVTYAGYLPYERRLDVSVGSNTLDIALLPDDPATAGAR